MKNKNITYIIKDIIKINKTQYELSFAEFTKLNNIGTVIIKIVLTKFIILYKDSFELFNFF